MLTKDLLRVSRRGGGYRPEFTDPGDRDLAARLLGVYQGHVGEPKGDLEAAVTELEREAEDFKLVRGFSKLLEREATFETRAAVDPERARRAAFEASEAVGGGGADGPLDPGATGPGESVRGNESGSGGGGVVTTGERDRALAAAAERLGCDPGEVAASLYADLPDRQVLVAFEPRWGPDELLAQYDLSLAQTALFDAVEVRARSSDPKKLISAVKRLGLLYEIRPTEEEGPGTREVVVTGPTALFRRTRRYGTRFARLLRTLAGTDEWRLEATVDDRGDERTMTLSQDDLSVPGVDPVTDVTFDSAVEADFAARFEALDLDWDLVREPDVLDAGERAMVPDFAFEYRHAEFRVYFEIMGFWTPEYVEKKLAQLDAVEGVELLVAVDEDLGVGEEIAARDHRVIDYSGTVSLKDLRAALRTYEADLVAESAAALPDELVPGADVVTLSAVADRHGVSEDAIEGVAFPEHVRVGRTLVRPAVLDDLAGEIEPGLDLAAVEEALDRRGIDDASAVLSELGYRIEWEGLSGGTVRERDG